MFTTILYLALYVNFKSEKRQCVGQKQFWSWKINWNNNASLKVKILHFRILFYKNFSHELHFVESEKAFHFNGKKWYLNNWKMQMCHRCRLKNVFKKFVNNCRRYFSSKYKKCNFNKFYRSNVNVKRVCNLFIQLFFYE